jgi:hypothetical protein
MSLCCGSNNWFEFAFIPEPTTSVTLKALLAILSVGCSSVLDQLVLFQSCKVKCSQSVNPACQLSIHPDLKLNSPTIVVEESNLESLSKSLYFYHLLRIAFSQAKESPQSPLHVPVPQTVDKRI